MWSITTILLYGLRTNKVVRLKHTLSPFIVGSLSDSPDLDQIAPQSLIS